MEKEEQPNLLAWLLSKSRVADGLTRIRVGGGVVGRLTWMLVVAFLAIAGIAIATRDPWISGGSLLLIFVLTLLVIPRLLKIIEMNPGTSVMEGSELLIHQQLQEGSKREPVITRVPILREDPTQPNPALPKGVVPPDQSDQPPALFQGGGNG